MKVTLNAQTSLAVYGDKTPCGIYLIGDKQQLFIVPKAGCQKYFMWNPERNNWDSAGQGENSGKFGQSLKRVNAVRVIPRGAALAGGISKKMGDTTVSVTSSEKKEPLTNGIALSMAKKEIGAIADGHFYTFEGTETKADESCVMCDIEVEI